MKDRDYDVIVIGGGSAGLTAAGLTASLGGKVTMVEREKPGGDCTWTGCVPSKALLDIAGIAAEIARGASCGIRTSDMTIDFARVMESVRATRRKIYRESDSPEVLAEHNVEVRKGNASFVDPHTILVESEGGEERLTARYIVICSGASPKMPEIAGVPTERILTTSSIFDLETLPQHLVLIGGGSVGVELAQAFRRLGSGVTIIERQGTLLADAEPEVRDILVGQLRSEGVEIHTGCSIVSGNVEGEEIELHLSSSGSGVPRSVRCDVLFAGVGRSPNVDALKLENAAVEWDETGIAINHSCQTSVSHIYACGDIAQGPDFTHVAENMAKTAVTRIMLKIPSARDRDVVPSVIFTDPELARVGLTTDELEKKGRAFRTIRFPYSHLDRARITGREEGLIVLHYLPLSGRILGAHIVGAGAGELIHEVALAMRHSLSLREISNTVHAYPSWSQGIRRAADQIYIQTGSPGALKLIGRMFGYRGEVSRVIGTEKTV